MGGLRTIRRGLLAGVAVTALLLPVGCVVQPTFEPSQDHTTLGEVEFIHYVATQPVLTFDEGCRAVLIAVEGEDPHEDFDARFADLESRGFVKSFWTLKSNSMLDRSTLAYMIFQMCDLPHGVGTFLTQNQHLSDRRFALREVVHYRIMNYGPTYEVVTGDEVLGALGSAEDYLARTGRFESGEKELLAPAHGSK